VGIRLVTGGVKSGKSRFAENLCASVGKEVIYIATSYVTDKEMEERVAEHRQRRPTEWTVIEEPIQLAAVVEQTPFSAVLLIECLSTWLGNILYQQKIENFITKEEKNRFSTLVFNEIERLLQASEEREIILVTNEVGLGGIAMHPIGRLFQDVLGEINQRIAQKANEVWFVIAGIPWRLKG
jgi:adenosylcobinamide kinase / adenosylcobinamide-phosphate guanylyltransferase